ncbi:MAG: SUMF1/EgtB/PvdO family nonheme iron enzyme [Bryobacteraceae bacterium]|nr:SUMF1/EgtB/PvdO family nonheme iron enzyme [Bryobacteraceae bacterium]
MVSSTFSAADLRSRAIHLLTSFFARDDQRTRRVIFEDAFDGCAPNPAREIDYEGGVSVFAANAVDRLLGFGCAARGKHALALLLETMASARGRQTHPDYHDLPAALNLPCELPTRAEECVYLGKIIEQIEAKARLYSPLAGKASSRPNAPALEPWADDDALDLLIRHQSHRQEPAEQTRTREYTDILTAFSEVKRAVLLGDPGSGKSTTLRRLALKLAGESLADARAPLPLLADLGKWLGDEQLSEFLAQQCPEAGWALEALARNGRLILLLDGLNEVPTGKRATKATEIRRFSRKLEKLSAQTALIGSCRQQDYVGDLDLGLDTLTLEPLSPQRIRAALRQWMTDRGETPERADRLFWQLAGDERLGSVLDTWLSAGAAEDAFWTVSDPREEQRAYKKTRGDEAALWRTHIPNRRSLLRLASNPFLLTMLFQVWLAEGGLPRNRGDLFGRFVNRLLSRERLLKKDDESGEWRITDEGTTLLDGLTALAWQMQTDRIASGQDEWGDFGVLTVAGADAATAALGSESLLKLAQDTTLLEGGQEIRFRHQLLQEYFTAKALLKRLGATQAASLWPPRRWWERSGWEEAAVLLAGLFSDDCSGVIRWLAAAQPEVASQCLLESGADVANKAALLEELKSAWMPRLTDVRQEPAPEGRAAIGRALGRLGLDQRTGVGLRPNGLPDIEWIPIRSGDFIYQEGERPRVETFDMARYPVTNIQFQAFLDDKEGYGDDRWWRGMENPEREPRGSTWTEPNHPRVDVSWFEAMAFCAWLADRLELAIRLPTEWEWERAARGFDGSTFPWGKKYVSGYANIDESHHNAGPHYLRRTSAVGIYPQGSSPEGVLDLAGNVWEWCLNNYQKPDRVGVRGTGSRVLRGGSWFNFQGFARAYYRNYAPPYYRYFNLGFRVVVSSPIGKR